MHTTQASLALFMSLIKVRKKGASPTEGPVAKYNVPQTGSALLEALALRVGAGDLEDAHGVSVTKADPNVAAGEYLFTPGAQRQTCNLFTFYVDLSFCNISQ